MSFTPVIYVDEETVIHAQNLNEIQDEVLANTSAKHTHSNKALLDTYTQTESDIADAVTKKHEHSNKSELDLIASGDKAKWDAKQDAITSSDPLSDTLVTHGSTTVNAELTAQSSQIASQGTKITNLEKLSLSVVSGQICITYDA